MTSNLQLNPRRLFNLLKAELLIGKRNKIMVAGGAVALITAFNYLTVVDGVGNNAKYVLQTIFPFVLLGGGAIVTSLCFNVLNSPQGRHAYLSLPASHLEKVTSKWIQTAILFPLITIVAYWLLSHILVFFSATVYDVHQKPLLLTGNLYNGSTGILHLLKLYLISHAIYFLGAISFRKFEIFKTALASLILLLIFAAFAFGIFRIIFADVFVGMEIQRNINVNGSIPNSQQMERWILGLLSIVGPIFFYVVAYFKLTEKEA